jgi:hypothetical protein
MSDERRAPPEDEPSTNDSPKDVLLAVGPTVDGEGASVVRVREGRIETGELRAARDGQPVLGELVKLQRRQEHAALFDAEVLARGPLASAEAASTEPESSREPSSTPAPSSRKKGPALVNSEAFRDGWESIFGARRDPRSMPS